MTDLEKLIEATFEEAAELNSTLYQRVHVTWNVLRIHTEHNISQEDILEVASKYRLHEKYDVMSIKVKKMMETINNFPETDINSVGTEYKSFDEYGYKD